jgi:hypothetical protein
VIDEGVVATGGDVAGMAVEQSIEPTAAEPFVVAAPESEEQPVEVVQQSASHGEHSATAED